jgi:hypothetical protein
MPTTGRCALALTGLLACLVACSVASTAHAQRAPRGAATGAGTRIDADREAARAFYQRAGREFRTEHYRILSDLGPDDTRAYGAHLDLLYEEYARRLAGLPQQAPEVPFVLMFAQQSDYLATLRSEYGINAAGSGGMFFVSPRGAALAFFTERLPRSRVLHVVQHEGFHQYAHSRFANTLPMWVNEGLAEFFGEAVVVEGRVVVGQASPGPVAAIRAAIEAGTTVPFLRMLTMTPDEWNENVRSGDAAIQYMQAWSMVQFLGWAEGGRHQRGFEQYLRLLHAGVGSERAFVDSFGAGEVANFEAAWKRWASAAQPTAFGVAASRLTYLAEGARQLSSEGVKVESLEELVARLKERDFEIAVTIHGRTDRLRADDTILRIPKDDLAKAEPVFEIVPQKVRPLGEAARAREAAHPTPPVITTRGLEPRELLLEWTRAKSGDAFDFRLLSPKEAPAPPPPAKRRAKESTKERAKEPAKEPAKPADSPASPDPGPPGASPTDSTAPKDRPASPEAA